MITLFFLRFRQMVAIGAYSASPSSSIPASRVRVRVSPINLSQRRPFPLTPLIIFLIFALTISTTTSIPPPYSQIPYSNHCKDVVPESPPTVPRVAGSELLQLYNAYFVGGDKILGQQTAQFGRVFPKSVLFRTRNAYQTKAKGVLKLDGTITFRSSRIVGLPANSTHRRLRLVHYRPPRIPVRVGEVRFRLHGFWSSSSGKLCMVGAGLSYLRSVNVVLKLNYPNSSTIATSLVNGTLQSIDASDSLNYFEPISILGVSLMSYEYTLVNKENVNGEIVPSDLGRKFCLVIRSAGRFELEYMNDCNTVNCNPLGGAATLFPDFMSFYEIKCDGSRRVRYLVQFANNSFTGNFISFEPNTTFVSEGVWDEKRKHLNVVACRVNVTNSVAHGSIGDCSIMLSLGIQETLSLKNRSALVGEIWSMRNVNDSSYFSKVAFKSSANGHVKLKGLRYEYTAIDRVEESCKKKKEVKTKGGTYPSGYSSDMRFDMTVRNKKGTISLGYSSPFFIGNEIYKSSYTPEFAMQVNSSRERVLNMSYMLSFRAPSDFKLGGEVFPTKLIDISAEGTYDTKTGVLCMIGCREIVSIRKTIGKNKSSSDCEIVVFIQYSALDAKDGSHVMGTIESTRSKEDPLYFGRLELSSNSIYTRQAEESIWRMDLEITMVLLSNTLACVFVGLQLSYVKKHSEVLPFISVVMLVVLTLAHLIPLVLNFEALFMVNRNRQNVFLGSGGWLEVNEVLVRVITMIAFLLQCRLLQLTWSARVSDDSHKNLWVSDKKVLYLSLPLYIAGALVAWFVQQREYSHMSPLLKLRHFGYRQKQPLWENLKSYAGLILDGFLFPQIVFNLFCNSKERALAPLFYIGSTVVRLLPHAYDLYRTRSSTWYFNEVFANPRMDYYSTAWDVTISFGGVLFVLVIYLQQRFGGRCIVPKRFKDSSAYEKVPVVGSE